MRTISPDGVNDMELLLNDLSVHGQFSDVVSFRESLATIMTMRGIARSFGRELYAHHNVVNRRIGPELSVFEALQALPRRDEKRAFLQWLTRQGPFWDDEIHHGPDDYLECKDEIVTETAPGEAAYCAIFGADRRLVSFAPSSWEYSPVVVRMSTDTMTDIEVPNYWQPPDLEFVLQQAQPPLASWAELERMSKIRFQRLTFSNDCYRHLDGHPFAPGAAERIISRLEVLNRLMGEVDDGGNRTPEGHRLYQSHFAVDRAWFSDSSDTEKNDFRQQLTFPNPEEPGQYLFCPWHGKINTPPFRIHFAWPERLGAPLFVAYIGLKITRR